MRAWQVTVENRDDAIYASERDRIACKFVLHTKDLGMNVEEFERAMTYELIIAIRKVKEKMIMEGIEP